MKRLTAILISLVTAFTAFYAVYGADTTATQAASAPQAAEAYIDSGRLVIEYHSGMSGTAVAAYYSGQTLCGAYISGNNGEAYTCDIPDGYTKIRVWFTDEDKMRTVQIIDRTAVTAAPTVIPSSPAPSPTSPTEVPTAEPSEEYDEGYGGFLESLGQSSGGADEDENLQTFTFTVECHNALLSDALGDELRGFLPPDGIITPTAEYTLTEGMTVYDALIAAANDYGFEVEYKSGYVSGIGGLYEFDCGPFSGWMYVVNGEAIMSPMDSYIIEDGDEVRVAYTCSLGDDLGQEVE